MSFILDALRKSENERQRNQQPGMVPGQSPAARSSSRFWLPLVALLVGINLALLLVMWIMSDDEQTSPAAATQSAAPANRALSGDTAPPPVYATPPQVGTDALSASVPPPGVQATPQSDDGSSILPTMEELILANAISLPPLQMDIHVYSDTPSERFVFINMTRYNEGQALNEGPMVVNITPKGIVLRDQGYDFLVTREQ